MTRTLKHRVGRSFVYTLLLILGFWAPGRCQVSVSIAPAPKLQFLDQNGNPLAGGCVFTYAAGTTNPLATYTTSAGTSQNTNPVILDSAGRASIWLTSSAYKFAVWSTGGTNCSSGTQQYTVDGITTFSSLLASNNTFSGSQAFSGAVTTTTLNGTLWVGNGAGQYPSLASAVAAASVGSTIYVSPNFTDPTWTSNLVINLNDLSILFTGNYFANTSTFSLVVNDGVQGFTLEGLTNLGGPNNLGANPCTGAILFDYRGTGAFMQMSSNASTSGVSRTLVKNISICLSNAAGLSPIGIDMYGIGSTRLQSISIGDGANGNSATCFRLNNRANGDSESNTFDDIAFSGCKIGFQNNGNTIDDFLNLNGVGSGTSGTIGYDCELNAAATNGCIAMHIMGRSISGYVTAFKCVSCGNVVATALETESTLLGGNDLVLDANSSGNYFFLTGALAKSVSDANGNNLVRTGNTFIDGAPTYQTGNLQYSKIRANQGTAISSSNISSLVGWGSSASITQVAGTDSAWLVQIASSGTGQAANPSFVFTYNSQWQGGNAPFTVCGRDETNSPVGAVAASAIAGSVTVTMVGTPVASTNYTIQCIAVGR